MSLEVGGGENIPSIPGACANAIIRIWQEAHCKRIISTPITINRAYKCKFSSYLDFDMLALCCQSRCSDSWGILTVTLNNAVWVTKTYPKSSIDEENDNKTCLILRIVLARLPQAFGHLQTQNNGLGTWRFKLKFRQSEESISSVSPKLGSYTLVWIKYKFQCQRRWNSCNLKSMKLNSIFYLTFLYDAPHTMISFVLFDERHILLPDES